MPELMPPPPYPADVRAKGWRLEWDYEQIEQMASWDLLGSEGRPWMAITLIVAWKQCPCGSMPADEQVFAAKIGIQSKHWSKLRDVLLRDWYEANDGRLYHPYMTQCVLEMMRRRRSDSDRQAERRRQKARESAMSHGDVTRDTGATPQELHPESGTDNRNQIPNTVENTKAKPARKRAAAAQLVSLDDLVREGVDSQCARDWLAVRSSKKLPLTPTAWSDTKSEASLAGLSVASAVKTAAANGWGGFKAQWLKSDRKGGRLDCDDIFAGAL